MVLPKSVATCSEEPANLEFDRCHIDRVEHFRDSQIWVFEDWRRWQFIGPHQGSGDDSAFGRRWIGIDVDEFRWISHSFLLRHHNMFSGGPCAQQTVFQKTSGRTQTSLNSQAHQTQAMGASDATGPKVRLIISVQFNKWWSSQTSVAVLQRTMGRYVPIHIELDHTTGHQKTYLRRNRRMWYQRLSISFLCHTVWHVKCQPHSDVSAAHGTAARSTSERIGRDTSLPLT